MNGILNVKIADSAPRCFINSGTFLSDYSSSLYHKHNYAEIHIVYEGEIDFYINGKLIKAKDGCAVLVPRFTYHCSEVLTGTARHGAFQIDINTEIPSHYTFGKQFLDDFFAQLIGSADSGNFARLSPFLSLICCNLLDGIVEKPEENIDYGFAINEFFSVRYNEDITIKDLAADLNLSEKQTQRLVYKHTNKTFGQNICDLRMLVADYLLENTAMSLTEISSYVGYSSYAGFFKARKKYLEENEEN